MASTEFLGSKTKQKKIIKELREIINTYDILEDLLNPFESKPWLIKNRIEKPLEETRIHDLDMSSRVVLTY